MIKYKTDIVQLLKDSGFNTNYIRSKKIFSESTMTKFRNNDTSITLSNLSSLCDLLNRPLWDLVEYSPDNINASERLFNLRNEHNLSKSEVAKQFNLDYDEYSQYESGIKSAPLDILLKACKLYNVPQSYFGINSDLEAVGNKGYTIQNTKTSEILDVTPEEFEMLKGVLAAYRNK